MKENEDGSTSELDLVSCLDEEELTKLWLHTKEKEKEAVELRRQVEDVLVKHYLINQQDEGTLTFVNSVGKVKVTNRLTRKVDSDKLQEIAAENGVTELLSSLFRWRAEINAAVWKVTDVKITDVLEGAITTSAGRPSFSIEKE